MKSCSRKANCDSLQHEWPLQPVSACWKISLYFAQGTDMMCVFQQLLSWATQGIARREKDFLCSGGLKTWSRKASVIKRIPWWTLVLEEEEYIHMPCFQPRGCYFLLQPNFQHNSLVSTPLTVTNRKSCLFRTSVASVQRDNKCAICEGNFVVYTYICPENWKYNNKGGFCIDSRICFRWQGDSLLLSSCNEVKPDVWMALWAVNTSLRYCNLFWFGIWSSSQMALLVPC